MTITLFLAILIGPSGRYLRGIWSASEILANLFRAAKPKISHAGAVHIINGQVPLTARYVKPYLRNGGFELLIADLQHFVRYYRSTTMLLDICARMHIAVIASDLSAAQIDTLNKHYLTITSSRDDIGTYLAYTLYAILNR